MKIQNTQLQSNLDLTLIDVLNECRPLIGDDTINQAVGALADVIEYLHDTASGFECENEDTKESAKDAATKQEGIVGQFNPLAEWTWEDVARELGDVMKSRDDLRDVFPGRVSFDLRSTIFRWVEKAVDGTYLGPLNYWEATKIQRILNRQISDQ